MILKDKIKNRIIEAIDTRIAKSEAKTRNEIYHVEKELFNYDCALIYRLWQINNANNEMLYALLLQNLTIIPNFHPKISIIVPVYNGEKYLGQALDSALNQTYNNIEIIIVDDGSTDHSASIAKKYLKKHPNIITYYKKKNGGVSSALNYGIKHMSGDYFAWLSHDDLMLPMHIARLVEWVSYEGHEYDIPFTSFRMIDENSNLLLAPTIDAQIFCSDFKISYTKNLLSLIEGEINGGSVLIPKKAFKECGYFDEKLRISQERDFWSRLIRHYHFINIPFDTACIRTHKNQVTNTNPNVINETNTKSLEILDNITTDEKIALFGDEISFYENIKYFSKYNNKPALTKAIERKIAKLKNKR